MAAYCNLCVKVITVLMCDLQLKKVLRHWYISPSVDKTRHQFSRLTASKLNAKFRAAVMAALDIAAYAELSINDSRVWSLLYTVPIDHFVVVSALLISPNNGKSNM